MDTLILELGKIAGNCTLNGYAGKIIVDSFSFAVSLPLNSDVANTERTMGRPNFSELSFTKMTDVASAPMFAACVAGTKLGDATLHIGRNEGGNFMSLIKYVMSNAMISQISTSGASTSAMDSFSLNYTKITMEYTQQNTDSTSKGTAQFGWDLTTNQTAA